MGQYKSIIQECVLALVPNNFGAYTNPYPSVYKKLYIICVVV